MTDNKDQRKISDLLISIEDQLSLLVKMFTSNDLNNKLILSRLNKLVLSDNNFIKNKESVTIPTVTDSLSIPKIKKIVNDKKITVGQLVVDNANKAIFMADVYISNSENEEIYKSKTNASGKWQAHLPEGSYLVKISKIIDLNNMNKIESIQNIQVDSSMKSLQLPIVKINR